MFDGASKEVHSHIGSISKIGLAGVTKKLPDIYVEAMTRAVLDYDPVKNSAIERSIRGLTLQHLSSSGALKAKLGV